MKNAARRPGVGSLSRLAVCSPTEQPCLAASVAFRPPGHVVSMPIHAVGCAGPMAGSRKTFLASDRGRMDRRIAGFIAPLDLRSAGYGKQRDLPIFNWSRLPDYVARPAFHLDARPGHRCCRRPTSSADQSGSAAIAQPADVERNIDLSFGIDTAGDGLHRLAAGISSRPIPTPHEHTFCAGRPGGSGAPGRRVK